MDAAIIGSAQEVGGRTTFYASGKHAQEFAQLQDFGLGVEVMGDRVGMASAFKMVYAGFTKGLSALGVELLLAAQAMGCLESLLEKLHADHEGVAGLIERLIPGLPFRAARRAEEMAELTETLRSLGLAPHMASASHRVLQAIGDLALASEYAESVEKDWDCRTVIEILWQRLSRSGTPSEGSLAR